MFFMLVTFDVSHAAIFPLKAAALKNMELTSRTLEVFHNEILSPLNEDAPKNIEFIEMTLEVSQLQTWNPCR